VLPDLGELNLKVLLVGANSEVGGGARDKLGSAHVTQPLRFRGFEALPKGANPVGATTVVDKVPRIRDSRGRDRCMKARSCSPLGVALVLLGVGWLELVSGFEDEHLEVEDLEREHV
jgi:hypothetical protein